MSLAKDDAVLRKPWSEGYPESSVFVGGNHRVIGGNYDRAGVLCIRFKARELTLSSDVIGWTKVTAKLGRTLAAGSGTSGAGELVSPVIQKPSLGVSRK